MADDDRTTLNEMLDRLGRSQRVGARVSRNIRESMGLPHDTTEQQMQILQALGNLAQIDAAVETAKLQAGADAQTAYGNLLLEGIKVAKDFYSTRTVAETGLTNNQTDALVDSLTTTETGIRSLQEKYREELQKTGGPGTVTVGKEILTVWSAMPGEQPGPEELQQLNANLAASGDQFNDVLSKVASVDQALNKEPGSLETMLQGNTDHESAKLRATIIQARTKKQQEQSRVQASLKDQGLDLESFRDDAANIISNAPRGLSSGAQEIEMVLAHLLPSPDEFDTSSKPSVDVEGKAALDDDDDLDFLQNKYKTLLTRLEHDMDDPTVAEQRDAIMATPKFAELVTELGLNPGNAQHRKIALNRYIRERHTADKEKLKAFRDKEYEQRDIRLSAAGASSEAVAESTKLPPLESIIHLYNNTPNAQLQFHIPSTDPNTRQIRLIDPSKDPLGDDFTFTGNAPEALNAIIRNAAESGRILMEEFNLAPSTSEVTVPTPAPTDATEDQRASDHAVINARLNTSPLAAPTE
jgi:hypothetical protein